MNQAYMRMPIWIFGCQGAFCIFRERSGAAEWISLNGLSGMLSAYPLDEGVYDWAVTNGHFNVKKDHHREPWFISSFVSGSQEHIHFEDGQSLHDEEGNGTGRVASGGVPDSRLELAWVFYRANISGVFSSRLKAEEWITKNQLTGRLAAFPPDTGYAFPLPFNGEGTASVGGINQVFASSAREFYRYEDGVRV